MKKPEAVLPSKLDELTTLLAEEIGKRKKLELEFKLGKLKKVSDLIKSRRRIAQIKTKIFSL